MAGYKPPYTLQEELEILEYIIKYKEYERVKGVIMWKEMANDFSTERTWQSLKEHFRRKMIPFIELPKYNILSKKHVKALQEGFGIYKANKNDFNLNDTPLSDSETE